MKFLAHTLFLVKFGINASSEGIRAHINFLVEKDTHSILGYRSVGSVLIRERRLLK